MGRKTTRAVAAAVLVTALLALAGGLIAVGLANRETDRQRLRSESRLRKDLEAVERLLTRTSPGQLEDLPRMDSLRTGLLEAEHTCRQGLSVIDRLTARAPSDPRFQRERATILEMLGEILDRLDRSDEAEAAYRKAIETRGPVLMKDPTSGEDRWRAALCFDHVGVMLHRAGRWEEAEHFLFRGRKLCEVAPPSMPIDPRVRQELVPILCHLSHVQMDRGRRAEALQGFADAVEVQKALAAASPQIGAHRENLVVLSIDQAKALAAEGQAVAAEHTLAEARELALRLRSDDPAIARHHELAASVLNDLASVIRTDPSRADEAREILNQAIAIQEGLVAISPAVPEYRSKLASMCDSLAALLRAKNAFVEAESLYRKALSFQSRLAAEQPQIVAYQYGHGQILHNLADLLRERGRAEEALPLQREAVRLLGSVYRSNVKNPDFRRAVSYADWTLAAILIDRDDHRAAAQTVAEYLRIEPNGYEESSEAAAFLCRCANLGRGDSAVAIQDRESLSRTYSDRAVDALRVAVRNGFRDSKTLRSDTTYEPLLARDDFRRLVREIEAMTSTHDESP
jgi:tetratricopeptide (TPR) repeat protein